MTIGNKLGDIGILQFSNETDNQGLGYIFVDSLFATAFVERQVTVAGRQVPQICQVVTTETTPMSSSPSAVLEIDSTTGAILVSRMTTADRNALTDPKNGMIIYNTTTSQFQFYQNNVWIVYGGGDVKGPSTTTTSGNLVTWGNTTGTSLNNTDIPINKVVTYTGNVFTNGIVVWSSDTNPIVKSAEMSASSLVIGVVKDKGLSVNADQKLDIDWVEYVSRDRVSFSKPIHVSDRAQYGYFYPNNYSALLSTGVITSNTGENIPMSIYAERGIISTMGVYTTSSINIKDVVELNEQIDNELLSLFKNISIKKYEYKDKIKNESGAHYGVIAEEVAQIMPHIVSDIKEFIPNIMRKGIIEYFDDRVRINFEHDLTEFLQGKFDKEKLQIFAEKAFEFEILDVGSNYIDIVVPEDKPENFEEVFVYGTFESCPSVSKERLFEMNIGVTQNLVKRVEELEKRLGV